MGVDVTLIHVEQQGSSPKRRRLSQVDVVLDSRDMFAQLCELSEFPILSRVEPYGTLILTSQEMEQFISEVEAELACSDDPEVRDSLKSILQLARKCEDERATELRLDGD